LFRVHRQYSDWAAQYDQDTAGYKWSAPDRLLAAVGELAPPKAGQRVLDVGIGTGLSSAPYAAGGARVTGLDLSRRMLEAAATKDLPFERLAEYDINTPLSTAGVAPGSFDLVLSCGTLHFATDLKATVAELASALAPGGILGFTFIPPQERAFGESTHLHSQDEVREMLEAAGLTPLDATRFVAYHDKGNPEDPVEYALVVAQRAEGGAPKEEDHFGP
jgi:predicted TPR repeat methyltransferase